MSHAAVALEEHTPPRLARDWISLLRPRQWYKNLLLFVGLVFSFHLADLGLALRVLAAFGLFCAVSSGIYALNDAMDAPQDRLHPRKRHRPVASGRTSPAAAVAVGVFLVAVGLAAAWFLHRPFAAVVASYVLLQAGYLFFFKHQVFLDLFSIALGLVLRAVAGVVLIGVVLSPWLILCTFFLALFLGLGKRRNELLVLGADAATHRRNLGDYSPEIINQATTVITASLVVSYSLYTFFHENKFLMATIPLALYGLFRYMFLVGERDMGGEPEAVFRDRPFLVNLVAWGVLTVLLLYGGRHLGEAAGALLAGGGA